MKSLDHRFSEIMKRKNMRINKDSSEKMVFYYRKGRIPTLNDQENPSRKHGFICLTQPTEGNLVYSNNPHRVQLQFDNSRRDKIKKQMQQIEEKYYKKQNCQKKSKSQSHSSQIISPQKRVIRISTDRNQDQKIPIVYRRRSNKMEKNYKIIESWAANGFKQINQKNRADSHEQIIKQKNLFKGLKGMKYYYLLARALEIPPKNSW